MKKKYLYIWIIIIVIIIFFFLFKKWIHLATNKWYKKENIVYDNYIIKDLSWNTYSIKLDTKLKQQCFTVNTWYKLISDNIIEKKIKIPKKIYSCLSKKLNFKEIKLTRRWDIVVDNKWFIHKINSNISINIIWVKIYWQ